MNAWLYKFLRLMPFLRIDESHSFSSEEMTRGLDRIIAEKQTQWNYMHPNEEFPGVEESELVKEFERRIWQK